MFFPEIRENLVGAVPKAAGAVPKAAGALPKALGALSFCTVRHGFS